MLPEENDPPFRYMTQILQNVTKGNLQKSMATRDHRCTLKKKQARKKRVDV